MEPDMDDFGHIDEFENVDNCPMCGEHVGADNMVEIEPGLDPVCGRCAEEYGMVRDERDAEARRDHAADMKMDDRRMGESTMFDKFMDRILTENNKPRVEVIKDSPQRARAAKHQERPLGRIRVGGR